MPKQCGKAYDKQHGKRMTSSTGTVYQSSAANRMSRSAETGPYIKAVRNRMSSSARTVCQAVRWTVCQAVRWTVCQAVRGPYVKQCGGPWGLQCGRSGLTAKPASMAECRSRYLIAFVSGFSLLLADCAKQHPSYHYVLAHDALGTSFRAEGQLAEG